MHPRMSSWMRTGSILFAFSSLFVIPSLHGQQLSIKTEGTRTSIRGLSVVNDRVIWASGSNGKVALSTNGGESWNWMTVPGFEKNDFRDIEAFDENTAIIMSVADPAYILRTKDAGKHWKIVYSDTSKGVFLDAMAFHGKFGMVIGDPLPGTQQMYRLYTHNKGKTWHRDLDQGNNHFLLSEGEAMFASSGTNLVLLRPFMHHARMNDAYIVTGGKVSSFIRTLSGSKSRLPMVQGKESTGANSIAAWDAMHLIITGGDFANDQDTTGNAYLSSDGGKTWQRPAVPPFGYRSGVTYIDANRLIACGTSGIDLSIDGGREWKSISKESFHVCQKAKEGNAVFLAGKNGRIARLIY